MEVSYRPTWLTGTSRREVKIILSGQEIDKLKGLVSLRNDDFSRELKRLLNDD